MRGLARRIRRLTLTALTQPILAYQRWISPAFAPRCRFYPSCSSYALHALRAHGPGRGLWLAIRRLLRCHPFHPGGFDPVPDSNSPDTSQVADSTVPHDKYPGAVRWTST